MDKHLVDKDVVIFDLDNVIYPERDYLLQVYYLFSTFVEFTQQEPPADTLVSFFKETYEQQQKEKIFEKAVEKFPTLVQFKENFERLHHRAQLPLKLIINEPAMQLMVAAKDAGKDIVILTAGDPVMQLNKIRQVEWRGMDAFIKVYFEDELKFRNIEPFSYLTLELGKEVDKFLYLGYSEQLIDRAISLGVQTLSIETIQK